MADVCKAMEERKEKLERSLLPKETSNFYSSQWGTGLGNKEGEFLGFSCKVCNYWRECGHEEGCPVKKLEVKGGKSYVSIKQRRL
jgi:hypothetical protein